jgi:hypothetical protein
MTGQQGAMFILAGFAGLLLVIALFSGFQGVNRLSDRGDDAAAVETVVREFAMAYGTYDYREPERFQGRLLELTTGAVHAMAANPEPDPVAIGQRRVTSARVLSASVSALSVDAAAVSVTVEQVRRSIDAASGEPVEEHVQQRVNYRLVREGDRWLVAEFRLMFEELLG